MQGPSQSTFRPTVVAAPPMAPPSLLRWPEAVLLTPDYIDAGVPAGGAPLPDDFTLQELLDLDLDSPEVLLAVLQQHGIPGYAEDPFCYLPTTETRRPGGPFLGVIAETAAFKATHEGHPSFVMSVEALRLLLRPARAMSRHFLAYQAGDDAAVMASWPLEGFNEPKSLGMAWGWWRDHMNAALSPFRMYVEYTGPASDSGSGLLEPSLYSACALQLAEYLSTEARVSFCANDRCRKPFTRQRAPLSRRRNADQFHTSGVLYCSRECLKRKSEQDRRDRRKAEKQGAS